jgi:hypothetical protein
MSQLELMLTDIVIIRLNTNLDFYIEKARWEEIHILQIKLIKNIKYQLKVVVKIKQLIIYQHTIYFFPFLHGGAKGNELRIKSLYIFISIVLCHHLHFTP